MPRATEPLDVFRDFMHVPDILERKWSGLHEDMLHGGIKEPRLAVTELQMFAHLGPPAGASETERLNRETLVSPGTLGEALYDTLIYHAAVRQQPFVEMVTHSATVNHGGGLRKEREHVYVNPCYFANQMFAEFAGAKAVKIEVRAPLERAPLVLPDIKNTGGDASFSIVDALAALNGKNELLLSLVNRGTAGPVSLTVKLGGFPAAGKALVTAVSGAAPWSANTLDKPEAVVPAHYDGEVRDGTLALVLPPFSVVQVNVARR